MQKKQEEILHDKKIIEDAEFFWGWATPAGKLRAKRRVDMVIHEIKSRGLSKALEIGSGTGVFTEFFCKAGIDLHCIDISFDLLKKLKNKFSNNRVVNPNTSDVDYLPYKDNSFDAVVGICVLHHFDISSSLKEITRVVRKGGIIVFSEPNMLNPQLMIQKNVKTIKRLAILGETEDETAFLKWKMKSQLKDLGFKYISIRSFDFLHPWTPKPLVRFVENLGFILERIPLIKEIAGSLFIVATK